MTPRFTFLLWLLTLTVASAVESPPEDLCDAVQDAGGIVWAYSYAGPSQIYRFDGREWEAQSAPFAGHEPAWPVQIARLSDGAVACVWSVNRHAIAVTRHSGKESRLLGSCEAALPEEWWRTPPLADSRGRLWITGRFAGIYRADATGVTMVHRAMPAELDGSTAHGDFNAIHAAEDGRGRVWAWSENVGGGATLRGALIFTGEKPELRAVLGDSAKDTHLSALTRADERHMEVAVSRDGIYRLDIDSLAAEQVPAPSPHALDRVHELHVDGDDLYAVEDSREEKSLWRRRDGEWTHLIEHLDLEREHYWKRSWLPVKDGLLVSAFGVDGPWYIPRQGEPEQFSWRSGFALEHAHALTPLADGTYFGIGENGDFFHGSLSFPPHDREDLRVSIIDAPNGWTPDAAAHLWMILGGSPDVLSEWNGDAWVAHPIPDPHRAFRGRATWAALHDLLTDAEGRVWVTRGDAKNALPVFDSATGEWQTFAGLQDAYRKLRDRPPHFLPLHPASQVVFDPQYSADHQRIAYRDGTSDFYYYDGAAWQHFDCRQVTGKTDRNSKIGPPWFDSDGRLCANFFLEATWRRDEAGHWSKTAFQSRFPLDTWSEHAEIAQVEERTPKGCVTTHPHSIVADNLGTDWLTWKHGLYRCVPGRCVSVFGDDEASPFDSLRYLQKVFVDGRGNAFLLTRTMSDVVMMIKPRPLAPRAAVAVAPTGVDAVKARLRAESASPVQFRWRLDEGAWNTTSDSVLTLQGLPNGAHALAVSAVDAELQTSAVPAVARFEVTIDSNRQMADLIARFAAPDYEQRKAAADALARQPDRAVPALQKARETADDDQRWWIDATLEKINQAGGTLPPANGSPRP